MEGENKVHSNYLKGMYIDIEKSYVTYVKPHGASKTDIVYDPNHLIIHTVFFLLNLMHSITINIYNVFFLFLFFFNQSSSEKF